MGRTQVDLRPTADYESMVRLGRKSGLEIENLGPVLAAYGLFEGEELVGCACLKEHEGSFLLECLAVEERLRGTGLGTRLVRAVETEARNRGATRLIVLARSPGFFQKVGYREPETGEISYPTLSGCAGCSQFNVTCFPAVFVRDF